MSTCNDLMISLRQPVPAGFLKSKDSQGTKISYVPWYNAAALADVRLGGAWSHELVEHWVDDAQRGSSAKGYSAIPLAHVRVRVTLHGDDRDISREAVGVDDEPNGQRGTPLERAEAAGLRRALAKFGLGLELYRGGAPLPIEADSGHHRDDGTDEAIRIAADDFRLNIKNAADLADLSRVEASIKKASQAVRDAVRSDFMARRKVLAAKDPATVN